MPGIIKIPIFMAHIKNIEGLTTEQLNHELSNGGKFVVFQYCVSILILTFQERQ